MGIFKQLAEKPWETSTHNVVDFKRGEPVPAEKTALAWLLASIAVVFALISIGYTYRLTLPDWSPLPDPGFLWLNTLVLLLSSYFLEQARKKARRGEISKVRNSLLVGGALTLLFFAGQFWVSTQLASQGYYAASNPANAFFYMITWLHALHLFGGMIAWTRTMKKLTRIDDMQKISLSVELCAIYWHFLFIVWATLFLLMIFS